MIQPAARATAVTQLLMSDKCLPTCRLPSQLQLTTGRMVGTAGATAIQKLQLDWEEAARSPLFSSLIFLFLKLESRSPHI